MIRLFKALVLKTAVETDIDPDFHASFYRATYPDLAHLKKDGELYAHYVSHGMKEGRFPSLAKARAHFEDCGLAAPPAFDPKAYRVLNPDLRGRVTTDWQLEQHFIEHGREEGRPFTFSGEGREPWHELFDLYDFLIFSAPWRPPGPLGLDEAMSLFEEEGVERLTPLARDCVFDPVFYRQMYALESDEPGKLYRDWLDRGIALGHAPNEQQAIVRFMGGRPYPTCLDWRRLIAFDEAAPIYPGKIEALQRFFEGPLSGKRRFVKGRGAAGLYAAVGDFHLSASADDLACEAYDLAVAAGGDTPTLYLHRGDARRQLGRVPAALADYQRAMAFPAHSVWAVHHAATLTQGRQADRAIASHPAWNAVRAARQASVDGSPDRVVALLDAAYDRWAGNITYRRLVDSCIDTHYRNTAAVIDAGLREGEVALANDVADRDLPWLADVIARLKLRGTRHVEPVERRVAMLACLDLKQCRHYRVEQKEEQLALHGIDLDVADLGDPDGFMKTLDGASAAIFYRVPAYPKVIEAILYARSLGIPTYYDIDDLIFTTDFPDTLASYGRQISHEVYIGLQHGVGLYRNAIALCDYGLASTQPLADRLAPLVRAKVAHVIPNGLDSRNEGVIRAGVACRPSGDEVTIFYGSGTKAHNQDFTDLVGPALHILFKAHPRLRLVVVGHLALGREFDAFAERIDRLPFVAELEQYWALLSTADINIAVLSDGVVTDCKSEIKWLEAAVLGIPSVVSPSATYRQVLAVPAEALFAGDSDEWLSALSSLIADPARRRAIGDAAREKALRDYALAATSSKLLAALRLAPAAGHEGAFAPAGRARMRVLVCNVFFAPQTYGGATRVVENNVDYLLDHHGDEFEVAVLATDEAAPPGAFRVDSYRDRPVFRIGTPLERNMDWRPFNDDNIDPIEHVLDVFRPDVLHLHCIQRLTATVVECALKRGIPYIVTAHDGWWLSDHQFLVDQHDRLVDPTGFSLSATTPVAVSNLQSVERRQRLRGLLRQAHAVLAVSRPFEAIYRGIGLSNTRTVENGLSPLPPPLPPTRRPKLVLGHIGGRSAHKGANLIEIALKQNAFENFELMITDRTIEYGDEIELLWGATAVTLRGNHPQDQVARLFGSFDVLLAPSIWPESYGLVTREADFYRKWVVTSRLGGIGADVEEGRTGFTIDVSGIDDLVRVLTMMNDDPDRFRTRAARTRPFRTADDQARELVAIYREIGTAGPARRDPERAIVSRVREPRRARTAPAATVS